MTFALGTARGKIEIEYDGTGVKDAEKDVDDLNKKTGDGTKKALGKVSNLAGGAGLAIAGGLGVAINAAANFEQRMSAVQAVSGANSKQMDTLRNKALQLGKDTAFSASQAGSAIEELVKAGISVPDVMNGAADATVALAAAGEVDLPEAATIASNAMNQFGLAAKDMPNVADKIAGAANASAIDVKDFGYSLSQVGAVAHLAGASFDDTATAIALMGNAGIKGSDAGTSLKSMFQRLQPTTKKQFETMVSLGLITGNLTQANKFFQKQGMGTAKTMDEATAKFQKLAAAMGKGKLGTVKNADAAQTLMLRYGGLQSAFYDTEGNMKSMDKVAGVLHKSLKGMTKENKQAALTTLFGSDAIRGAAVLADKGAKGFDKMAKSMSKVKAADVAKTRMNNLKGSIEQMKGSLETAGIAIGTIALPALRKLVDAVTGALNWFLKLSPGVQKAVLVILAVVGAVLLVVAAVGKMIIFASELSKALTVLKAAMAETWIAALGPIALIIAAIAAVVAIVIILWKHSETFRKIVTGAWNAVKKAAVAVWDWFKKLPAMFKGMWDSIVGAVKAGADAVDKWFQKAWDAVVNGVKNGINAAVGFIKSHWRIILSILGGPIGLAIALITKYWDQIKGVFVAGANAVLNVFKSVWNLFAPAIKAVWGLIVAILKLGWVIIKGLFLLELHGIEAIWNAVWGAIKKVITVIWNFIVGLVRREVNGLKKILTVAWNFIKRVTSVVWNTIKGIFKKVWGFIGPYVHAVINMIKTVISNTWNFIKRVTTAVWNAVVGFLKQRWDNLVHNLKAAWDLIKSVTSKVWNKLVEIIHNAVDRVVHAVSTIKDRVIGFFTGAGKWLYDAGKKIIQGLIDGIAHMATALKDKVTHVTGVISKFLPGSPVKEGPLKVLNNGYAGKQIIKMVVDGMGDQLRPVATASHGMGADFRASALGSPVVAVPSQPQSRVVNNHFTVNNPVPERASQSQAKVLRSRVTENGWSR